MFLGYDGVLISWAEGDTLEFSLHIEGCDWSYKCFSANHIDAQTFPPSLQLSISHSCPMQRRRLGKSFQRCSVTWGSRVPSAELAAHTAQPHPYKPLRTLPKHDSKLQERRGQVFKRARDV